MTLEKPAELPRVCSLLKEGRVAVTPMGEKLRWLAQWRFVVGSLRE